MISLQQERESSMHLVVTRGKMIRCFDNRVTLWLGNHIILKFIPGIVGGIGRRHVLHHLDEIQLL